MLTNPPHQRSDRHGIPTAHSAFHGLQDLSSKGFPQASSLAAAVLGINTAFVYSESGQYGEALSKLPDVRRELSISAGLLGLSEFSRAGSKLSRAAMLIELASHAESSQRLEPIREVESELIIAMDLILQGTKAILWYGHGPAPMAPVEEARHSGVFFASSKLRNNTRSSTGQYLGQAMELLYEAVVHSEQGEKQKVQNILFVTGLLLNDAKAHYVDRSMRAYHEHPEVDFRLIEKHLQAAREALSSSSSWQARVQVLHAVKATELL